MNKMAAILKISVLSVLLLVPDFAFSASVTKVNGKKALIQLDGLEAGPGTELFALNAEQKRKALIRLTQVKGDKAIGDIVQGAAQPGMVVIIKGTPALVPSYSDAPAGSKSRGAVVGRYKQGFGLNAGLAMSSMSFTAKRNSAQADISMTGQSFNLKALYDYQLSKNFTFRGATGLETLNVSAGVPAEAQTFCGDTATCSLSINYLTFEGSAQFNLTNSGTRFWLGGGFAFLLAMGKNTNISTLEVAGTNQLLLLSTGVDIGLGPKNYIPITLEYGLFPFAGVKLSGLYARAGYAWRF